jgi:hypothetical protein
VTSIFFPKINTYIVVLRGLGERRSEALLRCCRESGNGARHCERASAKTIQLFFDFALDCFGAKDAPRNDGLRYLAAQDTQLFNNGLNHRQRRQCRGLGAQNPRAQIDWNKIFFHHELNFIVTQPAFGADEKNNFIIFLKTKI